MQLQVELSLYPLGQEDLLPSIYAFVKQLERPGLHIELGRMSSVITGEPAAVFDAVRDAYLAVATGPHKHVLVAKYANAPLKTVGP